MINSELDSELFVFQIHTLLKNRQCKPSSENDFLKWVSDDNSELFCEWDDKLWGKLIKTNESCNIGPFWGMTKDIYSIPEGSYKEISKDYNLAFFLEYDFLSAQGNNHIEQYNIGLLSGLFMAIEYGKIKESDIKNEPIIKRHFPNLYEDLNKGYVFSEIAAFKQLSEKLKEHNHQLDGLILDKKDIETGIIRRHITVKMAAKILTMLSGKVISVPKVINMFNSNQLSGEKSSSIMISLESIFKHLEENTDHKNVNTFYIYENL